jgi:hypothetical protein
MRKLVVLIVIAVSVLLLVPAAASASTPTLKSLAKSLAALQKTRRARPPRSSRCRARSSRCRARVRQETSTIAGLQTTVAGQATTIASLQGTSITSQRQLHRRRGTIAGQAGTIAGLQTVVGADASHGLQKSVADIAANPALTLSWLPTYLTLDSNAENGVAARTSSSRAPTCNVHVAAVARLGPRPRRGGALGLQQPRGDNNFTSGFVVGKLSSSAGT